MAQVNRQEKDSLFKVVFGEDPHNALSLYNAINGTKYTNVADLRITTLKDTVYIGIKDDVSFLFNDDMNLYEHQSTYCPNMPLRGLGYFSDLYKQFVGGEEGSKLRLHGSKLVKVPEPKYYVFYNGEKGVADRIDLRLSDAYEGVGDIQVIAHMININKDHNTELMEQCRPLFEYSEFVYRLREHNKEGMTKENAVRTTIDESIRDGILEDLMRKERARMENILIQGLTEEERLQLYELESQWAVEDAREETRFEDVDKIVADGHYNAQRACEIIGVPVDKYQEHLKSKSQAHNGKYN